MLNLFEIINVTKAVGIDKISNKILKFCAPYIYKSLCALFNISPKTFIVPSDWKMAKVIPIFKSGNQCDRNNYRPISVNSAVARIFKNLVNERFKQYSANVNLINPRQSGFRSSVSTQTTFSTHLTNEWCFNIDRKFVNGVLVLDLKKAFDTVDHTILIKKLQYFSLKRYKVLKVQELALICQASKQIPGFQTIRQASKSLWSTTLFESLAY